MNDNDLIRHVAAALWKAESVDAGTPQSVVNGRTPEAFSEQSDYIRARWAKFARAAVAEIERLRAATFTAADLMKAWQMGRDAGAVEAQGEGWPDLKRSGPSERQEGWWDCGDAIADSIRALTPPTDLTEKVKNHE